MENIKVLNICYEFFNRFITSEELVEKLNILDKSSFSINEANSIDDLISGIKNVISQIPNEEDEFIIKRKQDIKKLIEQFSESCNTNEKIQETVNDLKNQLTREMDSHKRWFAVTEYIDNNEYFNEAFDNLSNYELLEFIAQYIKAPFPPQIDETKFYELVTIGIEKNENEYLWRLALNYEETDFDFSKIVDYYITTKNGYYLTELISSVTDKLDVDDIINRIEDKTLIEDLKDRKNILELYISEEQLSRLMEK